MSLKEKLDSFLLLEEGWDSYKSGRFSRQVIDKAKEVAEWLPGDGWQVVPCSGGDAVQFEKHADGFDIEVYVEAIGVVKSRGDTKMIEKLRGQTVNPHVVHAPLEPAPDFNSMKKAIDKCVCMDSEGEPLNRCDECPR